LISPLVTQLTYEGLIDELFSIKNCVVRLPVEKFASSLETEDDEEAEDPLARPSSVMTTKKINLSSAEELYAELRDKNFNAVSNLDLIMATPKAVKNKMKSIYFVTILLFR